MNDPIGPRHLVRLRPAASWIPTVSPTGTFSPGRLPELSGNLDRVDPSYLPPRSLVRGKY
jgi:hypothetical protein